MKRLFNAMMLLAPLMMGQIQFAGHVDENAGKTPDEQEPIKCWEETRRAAGLTIAEQIDRVNEFLQTICSGPRIIGGDNFKEGLDVRRKQVEAYLDHLNGLAAQPQNGDK